MLAAISVEPLASGNATVRLQAACRVVEPAMDNLTIARRGFEPGCVGAFEDEHAIAGKSERPCYRKPYDAGPDNHTFNLVHPISAASSSGRI